MVMAGRVMINTVQGPTTRKHSKPSSFFAEGETEAQRERGRDREKEGETERKGERQRETGDL